MGKLINLHCYSACRICLATDKKLVDIKTISLSEDAYTSLVGNVEHNPFEAICELCGDLLRASTLFRYTCHETNRFLVNMLERYELITFEMVKNYQMKPIDYKASSNNTEFISNYENNIDKKGDINKELHLKEEIIGTEDDDYSDDNAELDEYTSSDIVDKKNPTLIPNTKIKIENIKGLNEKDSVLNKDKKYIEICVNENESDSFVQSETSCKTLQNGPLLESAVLEDYVNITEMTPEMAREELLSRKNSSNYISCAFKCDLCYKGFENITTFNNHRLKHNTELRFKCDICHFCFHDQKGLGNHFLNCHKRKYTCLICPFVSYSQFRTKIHINMHKGRTYVCHLCGKIFRLPNTLLMHKRKKHLTECVCELCGDTFAAPVGLRSHKLILHRNEENAKEGSQCSVCDLHFATEKAYNRHLVLSSKHTVSNGCDKCGETFSNEMELSKHHRLHHARKQSRDYCTQCKIKFSSQAGFKEHLKSTHAAAGGVVKEAPNDVLPNQCEICGKMFKRLLLLTYHRRRHTGEKPHKCQQCGKTFRTPSQLFIHKPVHDADSTKFECKLCNRKYKRWCALRKHEKSFHLGLRPHNCAICGKSFPSQCEVRAHAKYVHEKVPWPKRNRTQRKYKTTAGGTVEAGGAMGV